MLPARSTVVAFGTTVIREVRTAEISFLAAAIAYYAFVSVVPLLVLLFVVVSTVAGDTLASEVVATTGSFLSPAGVSLVERGFESRAGRGSATAAGLAVLLWSSLKLFRGFDTAFSRIYHPDTTEGLPEQLLDAVTVLVGSFLAVVAMVAVSAALALLPVTAVTQLLGSTALAVALTVVFLPLFYVFPDVDTTVREVVPGAAVAGVGWTVLQAGFSVYTSSTGSSTAYGVVGGVLVLLTWFYFAANLVLIGAVVNVVLSKRT
jgi:membrane protein